MEFMGKIVTFVVLHSRGIRRFFGMLFLGGATVMVIIGSQARFYLSPEKILLYWGTVFLLLSLTLMIALLDIRALRRDFRIQKKALFVSTFSDEEFRRKIREKHPEIFSQQE
jgi:ATP/ADP translocase